MGLRLMAAERSIFLVAPPVPVPAPEGDLEGDVGMRVGGVGELGFRGGMSTEAAAEAVATGGTGAMD